MSTYIKNFQNNESKSEVPKISKINYRTDTDIQSKRSYVKSVHKGEKEKVEQYIERKESHKNKDGSNPSKYKSNAQIQAMQYLNDKKIFELFNFLIGHLLVNEPNDPIKYLYDLLDKCIDFRLGLVEPPLLFTPRHIESMFHSLDPAGLGNVSLDQYRVGLTTLGINCFDPNPTECTPGRVSEQTFKHEAEKCLVKMLSQMLRKST